MTAAPQPQPSQTPPTTPAPSLISKAYVHSIALLVITYLVGEVKKTYLGSAAPAPTATTTAAVPAASTSARLDPFPAVITLPGWELARGSDGAWRHREVQMIAKAPESASTTMPPGQYFDYNGRPVR